MIVRAATMALAVALAAGDVGAAPVPAREDPPPADTPAPEQGPSEPPRDPDPRQEALVEEAMRHWVEGKALFERGQYLEAAAEFERSYAAIPDGRTLYNISLSYEKGGRTVDAIRAAQRYLALPDCASERKAAVECASARGEVEQTLVRLRALVGEIRLDIEPGVRVREVRIDGRTVPLDAFPLPVEPGTYAIEVFGMEPSEQRRKVVEIAAGDRYPFVLGPWNVPRVGPRTEPRTSVPTAPRVDPLARRKALRATFWTGVALTVASGAALATVGALAKREERRFEDDYCGQPARPDCMYAQGDNLDRFARLKPATNAMIGVTAALAAATVVVGIFAFTRPGGTAQRASTRTRVRPSAGGLRVWF
jgi:tetratricopeptide (TPR) repeat protein